MSNCQWKLTDEEVTGLDATRKESTQKETQRRYLTGQRKFRTIVNRRGGVRFPLSETDMRVLANDMRRDGLAYETGKKYLSAVAKMQENVGGGRLERGSRGQLMPKLRDTMKAWRVADSKRKAEGPPPPLPTEEPKSPLKIEHVVEWRRRAAKEGVDIDTDMVCTHGDISLMSGMRMGDSVPTRSQSNVDYTKLQRREHVVFQPSEEDPELARMFLPW